MSTIRYGYNKMLLDKIICDKTYGNDYWRMEAEYIKFLDVIKMSFDLVGVK